MGSNSCIANHTHRTQAFPNLRLNVSAVVLGRDEQIFTFETAFLDCRANIAFVGVPCGWIEEKRFTRGPKKGRVIYGQGAVSIWRNPLSMARTTYSLASFLLSLEPEPNAIVGNWSLKLCATSRGDKIRQTLLPSLSVIVPNGIVQPDPEASWTMA
jgi:hypothetical protein